MNEVVVEPGTRARWLGAVLIVLLLALLVRQAWDAGHVDELPPVGGPIAPVGKLSLGEMLAGVDSTRLGMQAASAVAAAAAAVVASAPLAQDEIEVCGVGRVKVDAAGEPVDAEVMKATVEKTRQVALDRVLPVLAGSPDEAVRAAGLLLQSGDDRQRDALARLAVGTQSPEVYRIALLACRKNRDDGVCQMLSAEQLARIDPQSLSTWLDVVADAQARGDAAAVDEALYRASRTTRAGASRFADLVMNRLPAEMPAFEKALVAGQITGFQSVDQPAYQVARQHCSDANVRDSNRQQTCLALAEVFSTQGTTLRDLSLGIEIGRRTGWSALRVATAVEESDALMQLSNVNARATRQPSCDNVEKTTRRVTDMGREGELVVLRRQLKQSPDSAAVLAARFREMPPLRAAAASAAAPQ